MLRKFHLGNVAELTQSLDTQLGPRVAAPGLSRFALVNNAADVALVGQVDQLKATGMLQAFTANTVAPVLLMGWLLRIVPPTPMQTAVRSAIAETVPIVHIFKQLAAQGQLRPATAAAAEIVAYTEADAHRPPTFAVPVVSRVHQPATPCAVATAS